MRLSRLRWWCLSGRSGCRNSGLQALGSLLPHRPTGGAGIGVACLDPLRDEDPSKRKRHDSSADQRSRVDLRSQHDLKLLAPIRRRRIPALEGLAGAAPDVPSLLIVFLARGASRKAQLLLHNAGPGELAAVLLLRQGGSHRADLFRQRGEGAPIPTSILARQGALHILVVVEEGPGDLPCALILSRDGQEARHVHLEGEAHTGALWDRGPQVEVP
mmetsp:Transcript_73149/g.156758  ORF Transcript_73149/g.156758 Transcript_73149/m.156758 type:complete len:216 (+) Transcript_73149:779-1426(+)